MHLCCNVMRDANFLLEGCSYLAVYSQRTSAVVQHRSRELSQASYCTMVMKP